MNAAVPTTKPPFQDIRGFRWTGCGLMLASITIHCMDRQVLGTREPDLERALGWDEIECAHIVIAFLAAYAIGLLGFGRFIDRIGTRHGYPTARAGKDAT